MDTPHAYWQPFNTNPTIAPLNLASLFLRIWTLWAKAKRGSDGQDKLPQLLKALLNLYTITPNYSPIHIQWTETKFLFELPFHPIQNGSPRYKHTITKDKNSQLPISFLPYPSDHPLLFPYSPA